ncbi:MAG: nucleotidyl transferase AbiEii/AbiGii toxin family protein [Dictyoglomaceae bacterium]|nr:nucleotidyl transferase AbiEii/AbiGii toxin family protein [Dictyoglomaceae bacterium]
MESEIIKENKRVAIMIDKETIKRYAKINNIRPWQQEKHYIQSCVLISLSEFQLVFKGGTYLWFFHGLKRFSEDLDFTLLKEESKDIAIAIHENLLLLGIENEVRAKRDEKTESIHIKAKGPLSTSDIDLCHVYVEISKREEVKKKTAPYILNQPFYNLPIKIIRGMDLVEVGAEKVRAIFTRKKARDLYDLYYLINDKKIDFDVELINEKLDYYKLKFSRQKFISEVQKFEKEWKKELESLVLTDLPPFKDVKEKVSDWISKD